MTDPKPPLSDARLAANRANALKSTGPRSPEGKARSSRNALTHGLCTRTIEVPDEDPALLAERYESWKDELNPGGSAAGDYLVLVAARKSVRLDRCHLVHEARVAQLARDARNDLLDARMVEVESLLKLLATEPDAAVRRLKLTPEGCDALLTEWRHLEQPLRPPAHWDDQDHIVIDRLMGLASSVRRTSPSPFALPTKRIAEHREVAHKLWLNECPKDLFWNLKYKDPAVHERDKELLPWLAELAEMSVEEIRSAMAAEVAWLEARKAELRASEVAELEEATYRARFDATEPGRLLRRYEAEAERGLYRAIKEARDLNKGERDRAQSTDRTAATPGIPARNEPSRGIPRSAFDLVMGEPRATIEEALREIKGPSIPRYQR